MMLTTGREQSRSLAQAIIILLLFVLLTTTFVNAATTLKGLRPTITEPTVFTVANSPYIIQDYAVLSIHSPLTIQAGVQIKLGNMASIEVLNGGRIESRGTSSSRVVFTATNIQNYWRRILFKESDTGSLLNSFDGSYVNGSIFDYTDFSYGGVGGSNMIQLSSGNSLYISRTRISKVATGSTAINSQAAIVLTDSTVSTTTRALVLDLSSIDTSVRSVSTIQNNQFSTTGSAIKIKVADSHCIGSDYQLKILGNSFTGCAKDTPHVLQIANTGSEIQPSNNLKCKFSIMRNQFRSNLATVATVRIDSLSAIEFSENIFSNPGSAQDMYYKFYGSQLYPLNCAHNYWGSVDANLIQKRISGQVWLPTILSTDSLTSSVAIIVRDTTWKEGTQITFYRSFEARQGSLTIEPNVTVLLPEGANFIISSELVAIGTPTKPILFTPSVAGKYFGAIRLSKTVVESIYSETETYIDDERRVTYDYEVGSTLTYVQIRNAGKNAEAAIIVDSRFVMLSNIDVRNTVGAAVSSKGVGGPVWIIDSYFESTAGIRITHDSPKNNRLARFVNNSFVKNIGTTAIITIRLRDTVEYENRFQFESNLIDGGAKGASIEINDGVQHIRKNTWRKLTQSGVAITSKAFQYLSFEGNVISESVNPLSIIKTGFGNHKIVGNKIQSCNTAVPVAAFKLTGPCAGSFYIANNTFTKSSVNAKNGWNSVVDLALNSPVCPDSVPAELYFNFISDNVFVSSYATRSVSISLKGPMVTINRNIIQDTNNKYSLRTQNPVGVFGDPIDARYNYFGTNDTNKIKSSLYDTFVNPTVGRFLYSPYLSLPDFNAPEVDQICSPGYLGIDCNIVVCSGKRSDDKQVCSGVGTCVKPDVCQCPYGTAGKNCELPACYGIAQDSPTVCSGHGFCSSKDNCTCAPGYTGTKCSTPVCFSDSKCSGHGSCTAPNTCKCEDGYTGEQCETKLPPMFSCYGKLRTDPTVCSSQGVCKSTDVCQCNTNYVGLQCETYNAPIKVSITSNVDGVFNRGRVLQATGTIAPENRLTDMNIEWVLYKKNVVVDIMAYLSAGLTANMRTISFKSYSLEMGETYILQLRVKYKTDTTYISKSLKIQSSIPPIQGQFTLSPKRGVALSDIFTMSVSNWISTEDGDLQYRFGYFGTNGQRVFLNSFSVYESLSTTLPVSGNITAFVQAITPSGDQSESQDGIIVDPVAPSAVASILADQQKSLSSANGAQFETQISVIASAISTYASSTLKPEETSQLIGSLINTLDERQSEVGNAQKIETIARIAEQIQYVPTETTLQSTNILENALKSTTVFNRETIQLSIDATTNLAESMIASDSSYQQKASFSSLFNEITTKLRDGILENQLQNVSMPALEAMITRVGRTEDSTPVVMTIPVPFDGAHQLARSLRSITEETPIVVVTLDSDALNQGTLSGQASVFVQGEVLSNPPQEFTDTCQTSLVSSTVSVKMYNEDQALITNIGSSKALYVTQLSVAETRNGSYAYVCKFYDVQTMQWLNDTSICETVDNQDGTVSCHCFEPVTHAVSLDYIQAGQQDEEETTAVCTNPCGCSARKSTLGTKLPTYSIVLIVIAALSAIIAISALIALIAACIYNGVQPKPPKLVPIDLEGYTDASTE